MNRNARSIDDCLAILAETPLRLAGACSSFSDVQLRRKSTPTSWSVLQIIAHLDACSVVWGESIDGMLECNGGIQQVRRPRDAPEHSPGKDVPVSQLVEVFQHRRLALLALLAAFQPDDWARSATIGAHVHTIASQVQRMAHHEERHWPQLFEAAL